MGEERVLIQIQNQARFHLLLGRKSHQLPGQREFWLNRSSHGRRRQRRSPRSQVRCGCWQHRNDPTSGAA